MRARSLCLPAPVPAAYQQKEIALRPVSVGGAVSASAAGDTIIVIIVIIVSSSISNTIIIIIIIISSSSSSSSTLELSPLPRPALLPGGGAGGARGLRGQGR